MSRLAPIIYCSVSGKVCFDKRGAQTAMNARFKEDHEKLRMYPCPDCQREHRPCWHLTKQELIYKSPHYGKQKPYEADE